MKETNKTGESLWKKKTQRNAKAKTNTSYPNILPLFNDYFKNYLSRLEHISKLLKRI